MATYIEFTNATTGEQASLSDNQVITAIIQGPEATPDVNIYEVKIVRKDGQKVTASDYAERPMSASGRLSCASTSILRTKIEDLKRIVSGKGYLDVGFDGGTTRRYTVQVKNWDVQNQPYYLTWLDFTVNFVAIDTPFGEDIDYTTLFDTSGIGGDIEQTDSLGGSADPAVNAQIKVDTLGGLAGVEFKNTTNNTALLVQPSFAANDTLVIDSGKQSCLLNGLPVDFSGQVPTFLPKDNDWRINFLSDTVGIDTKQETYNTNKFVFGNTWFAQSFQASGAINCNRIDLMLSRYGDPSSVEVLLYSDSAGAPGTALAGGNASVDGPTIPTTPGFVSFYLQNAVALSASTTYWIVVKATGSVSDANNGFYLKASSLNPYATYGLSRSGNAGSSWTAISNYDMAFRVWKAPVLVSNADTGEELYSEDFSATTNEDSGNTTANWDIANKRLVLGTSSTILDTGYKFPSVTPAPNGASNDWTNPSRVFVADGSFATNATAGSQSFTTLGLGIPSGAIIRGIEARVTGKVSSGTHNLAVYCFPTGNLIRQSQAISNPLLASLGTTSAQVVVGGSTSLLGQSWVDTDFSDANLLLFITAADSGVTYSVDALELKVYYSMYDPTKNVGQTNSLNASGAANMAVARLVPTETLPTSTDSAYDVQADASSGFLSIGKNSSLNLPMPALGTTPAHKWKAILTGLDNATPAITGVSLYYKGAMPLAATTDRLAQSFSSGAGGNVSELSLNLVKTVADTIDYTVEIQADSAGAPSGTPITNGSATISAADVPDQGSSDFGWVRVAFATAPTLSASTTYWIVIKIGTAGSSKLLWRARGGNSYGSGSAAYSTNSGSAYSTLTNQDFLFQLINSGTTFSTTVTVKYKARSL